MKSKGDPRVHFVMNVVLSFLFSWLVVAGLAFIDVVAFSWRTVGLGTVALFLLTYLAIFR